MSIWDRVMVAVGTVLVLLVILGMTFLSAIGLTYLLSGVSS